MISIWSALLVALPESAAVPADSFTVRIEVPSQGDTLRGFIRVAVEAARAAEAVERDTMVNDSHSLPVAGTAATPALLRWLRSECGG